MRAYGTTLYMAALAAALAVLLINMTRAKQPWPLPWFLRLAITAPSMRWFMMWAYVEEVNFPISHNKMENIILDVMIEKKSNQDAIKNRYMVIIDLFDWVA